MPCPECDQYQERAERVEETERLLLLFTDVFSKLSKALIEIENEQLRRRYEQDPPPLGAAPVKRRRYYLVSVDQPAEQSVSDSVAAPA